MILISVTALEDALWQLCQIKHTDELCKQIIQAINKFKT